MFPLGDLRLKCLVHAGELLRPPGNLGCQLRVGLPQFALCLAALDKLADLAPDSGHHLDQVFVGLMDLAAEERHDAVDFRSDNDRKTQGRPQPQLPSDVSAHEVLLRDKIRDPNGPTLAPHAAGHSKAGVEGHLHGRFPEPSETSVGSVPLCRVNYKF